MTAKVLASDIERASDKLILKEPHPQVSQSDDFCQYAFAEWWRNYEEIRQDAKEQPKNMYIPQAYQTADYTKYPSQGTDVPRPRVPVESFMGENYKPYQNDGYRKANWGCFLGCQDLRVTIEWVMAILFTNSKHARATYSYSYVCPEGQISISYESETIREQESKESIDAAIKFFKSMITRFKNTEDEINIYGDTNPKLRKCGCFDETPELLKLAEYQLASRIKGQWLNSRPRRGRPGGPATQGGSRRSGELETSDQPTKRRKASPTATVNHDEIDDVQRAQPEEQITCYDFDYPELHAGPPSTMATVQQAQTGADPDLLRASLALFADFDGWQNEYGYRNRGSGAGKGGAGPSSYS